MTVKILLGRKEETGVETIRTENSKAQSDEMI